MSFFTRIWAAITGLFAVIWPSVEPLLKDLATEAGKIALKYAAPAVLAAMGAGLSGDAAKKQAFDAIVKGMESDGLKLGVDYATRIVNQSIEAMVAKLVPK
jgi:predicted permease